MKRFARIFSLVALFLVSFVVFSYLTFPYEVLKEAIATKLSEGTGQTIRIGDMGPKLPIGIEAENVTVIPSQGPGINIDKIVARIGILSLLIGKFNATAAVETGGGTADLDINFSIFDLINQEVVPEDLSFQAVNFPLDGIATYGISMAANGPGANPMVAPLLSAIGVTGKLTGDLNLDLDTTNPTLSSGQLELRLLNSSLRLSDKALGFKDQNFSKALFKADVKNGQLVVDKESGLVADELFIDLNGRIKLDKYIARSETEIDVAIRLAGALKNEFGFIIDAATGSLKDGQMILKLRGPLGSLQQTAI